MTNDVPDINNIYTCITTLKWYAKLFLEGKRGINRRTYNMERVSEYATKCTYWILIIGIFYMTKWNKHVAIVVFGNSYYFRRHQHIS